MQEDKELHLLYGENTPFKVPAGYFEGLNEHLMVITDTNSGKRNGVSMWKRWSSLVAIAASVCTIVSGAIAWICIHDTPQTDIMSNETRYVLHESNIDDAADYLMLDDDDIYKYIAEN